MRAELLRENSRSRSASCHIIALDALDAIVYSRHQLLDGVCSAFGCKVGAECLAYQENVTQSSWNTSSASFTKIPRDDVTMTWFSGFDAPMGREPSVGGPTCMPSC